MECKARSVSFDCPEPISVLIETSWNVKKKLKTIMRICRRVLIETSWNVKLYTTFYIVSIHRINRNIVECKGRNLLLWLRWKRVLIETSWNVKINGKTKAAITIRINRNIVECKEWYYKGHWSYEGVLIETSWNVKLGTSTHKTARIPY